MKSSYIYGLVLLGLVLSANALEAEIAGPGRDLLAKKAKCKFNDKKEYYGASYFIKLADATHQHGVKTCCELCAKEPGCRKFNFNGNGHTSACQLYKAGAPGKKWGGCPPGKLCGHSSGRLA